MCETPKSPPGDYNARDRRGSDAPHLRCCVKHLNPRQGITTGACCARRLRKSTKRVKHLNPRQGITTGVALRYGASGVVIRV